MNKTNKKTEIILIITIVAIFIIMIFISILSSFKVCEEVAEYKVASGKKVLDKQREMEKLKVLYAMANSEFNGHCIEELFSQIMAMSRKMQYSRRIFYWNNRIINIPFCHLLHRIFPCRNMKRFYCFPKILNHRIKGFKTAY